VALTLVGKDVGLTSEVCTHECVDTKIVLNYLMHQSRSLLAVCTKRPSDDIDYIIYECLFAKKIDGSLKIMTERENKQQHKQEKDELNNSIIKLKTQGTFQEISMRNGQTAMEKKKFM